MIQPFRKKPSGRNILVMTLDLSTGLIILCFEIFRANGNIRAPTVSPGFDFG